MSDNRLTAEKVRAAAEVHRELDRQAWSAERRRNARVHPHCPLHADAEAPMPDRDVTERAKCLLSGVTPGLWLYRDVIGGLHNVTVDMWDVAACSGGPIEDEEERRKYAAANAEFIAAAPQLVTDLLAEVVRLQALLNPVENWHGVVKGIN